MGQEKTINVAENMHVNVSRWGAVDRIDVSQMGAIVPQELRDPGRNKERRTEWAGAQKEALLATIESIAAAHGGSFDSYAEWTVLVGALYDWSISAGRREKFSGDYRSAISSLWWAEPTSGYGALFHLTAFVPQEDAAFRQFAWRPKSLYDTEYLGLAPAVISEFGGVRNLFLSGIMPIDTDRNVQHPDNPRDQVRYMLGLIDETFREAGGTVSDVVRLRPFVRSSETARIVREEVSDLWKGAQPVITMADTVPMPEGNHAEIQVMGVLGGTHQSSRIEGTTTTMHLCCGPEWDLLVAGEFTDGGSGDARRKATSVLEKIRLFMEEQRVAKDDVCLAYVYAGSAETAAAFQALAGHSLNESCLHVVPSRPIQDPPNVEIKVEITARRRPDA